MSYEVGDIVKLKFSNNPYVRSGSLLKVESVTCDAKILNVSFKSHKYIVHVDDVKIASPAKEKVAFT